MKIHPQSFCVVLLTNRETERQKSKQNPTRSNGVKLTNEENRKVDASIVNHEGSLVCGILNGHLAETFRMNARKLNQTFWSPNLYGTATVVETKPS